MMNGLSNRFGMGGPRFDQVEVRRALSLLHADGQRFVLTATTSCPGSSTNPALRRGLFCSADTAVRALSSAPGLVSASVTLNPLYRDLVYGGVECLADAAEGRAATKFEVEQRRWLPIVLQPTPQVSAHGRENDLLALVATKAKEVTLNLSDFGWPEPVVAANGPGLDLLYRIDLPSYDGGRVATFLEKVIDEFSDDQVQIDRSAGDAAHSVPLYNLFRTRGQSMGGNGPRMSSILHVPQPLLPVLPMNLEAFAPVTNVILPEQNGKGAAEERLQVEDWLARHGIAYQGPGFWAASTLYALDRCPWNPDHVGTRPTVLAFFNGVVLAWCNHPQCHGKSWEGLRDLYEPGWRATAPRPSA